MSYEVPAPNPEKLIPVQVLCSSELHQLQWRQGSPPSDVSPKIFFKKVLLSCGVANGMNINSNNPIIGVGFMVKSSH